MLLEQEIAHAAPGVELVPIVEHVRAQHLRQSPHDVQQHDIMRGLVDRDVQVGVGLGLVDRIVLAVAALDPAHAARDRLEIDLGGAVGGELGRRTVDGLAELQIVVGGLGPRAQQLGQRVGDASPDCRDRGPASRLPGQQALLLQELQPLAHCRPRHGQPFGQLALGPEPLAGTERSFEDQSFDVLGYCFCRLGRLDCLRRHPRVPLLIPSPFLNDGCVRCP